ncbi:MAG: carboxynorspermidine decarboxylase [Sphingobium sp.]|jgi:carboxynorspermidine decarboxylase|nr:carboxynorspermidine decarboxylase [Sphingobium sp.]MCI1272657.1 carboxynorspermidine decarboxylase [Sphingobium sp.]MCI1756290.1 carboxynorspermidine decarboxylase [Sphingobium sp.]MCI2052830.1 carboxynorspermidine decarboxylase [Sphingobium sp.]
METRAGDPGAFARFDLTSVPSPAFVVDEAAVRRNLAILADVRDRTGIKLLSALKAFSMWSLGGVVGEYLDGVCASGLYEARLGREEYKGEVATYCAGYKAEDLPEICALSDHIIFNSPGQHARFRPILDAARAAGHSFDVGLRINPLYPQGEVAKYDPCQPHSRLGFPVDQLRPEHLDGVDGLHFHTLCEQDFAPLARTWAALEPRLASFLPRLKWLNFGGGHHITRADYQRDELVAFLRDIKARTGLELYLEPGEAVALDAGILVGEILDVIDNGMPVAITDISATCHMPDVIEAPYRPAMLHEAPDGPATRLGGPSCLAGDIIGDYRFGGLPHIGQRFAFLDQAHYSMVKTNTFNGVPLPAIWLWNSETGDLRAIRTFNYSDFKARLS